MTKRAGWIWLLIGVFGAIGSAALAVHGQWGHAIRSLVPVVALLFLGLQTVRGRFRDPLWIGVVSIAVGCLLMLGSFLSARAIDSDENAGVRVGLVLLPSLMIAAGILALAGRNAYRRERGQGLAPAAPTRGSAPPS